jgi:hypothetical protein
MAERSSSDSKILTRPVPVFFYGSYINRDVLAEVDLTPEDVKLARLAGFELRIRPLANIVRAEQAIVYGIVFRDRHDALARLYEHAEYVLGGVYLPEAVLVEVDFENAGSSAFMPCLTYIAHHMDESPAGNAYVDRIAGPGRAYGFPNWYIDHIESFRT